jgi:hypothetical protein
LALLFSFKRSGLTFFFLFFFLACLLLVLCQLKQVIAFCHNDIVCAIAMLQGTAPMDTEVMKTMSNTLLSSSFTVPSHWLHMTKTEHSKCLSFLKVYFKMILFNFDFFFFFFFFQNNNISTVG